MKNINRIRLIIECLITILLLWVFPFNIERKLKLFALYVFFAADRRKIPEQNDSGL